MNLGCERTRERRERKRCSIFFKVDRGDLVDQKSEFTQVADRSKSDNQIVDSIKIDQPYRQGRSMPIELMI